MSATSNHPIPLGHPLSEQSGATPEKASTHEQVPGDDGNDVHMPFAGDVQSLGQAEREVERGMIERRTMIEVKTPGWS
jgi:hypothetical protein